MPPRKAMPTTQPVTCAEEARKAILPAFPRRLLGIQECFCVLCLDSQHKPMGRPILVAVGSASSVEVHPRDVFRQAIRRNATAIIVGHNHPSGNATASPDDTRLTQRLVSAGELLGVPVLDHIILGDSHTCISLSELGLL